jgi:phosphonate dehydrogenase
MVPKVVVSSRIHQDALDLLAAECQVLVNRSDEPWSRQELLAQARDASGLLVCMTDHVDRSFVDQCPGVRIIAGVLKGFDNIDVEACTAAGVWLSNVPDRLTGPTAELTVGLMIGLSRKLTTVDAKVRNGHRGWRPLFYSRGLEASVVGILGFGAIGEAVARRLRPFGCELVYYDERAASPATETVLGIRLVSFDDLLGMSDFVVIALPLTDRTYHLINGRSLQRFKQGAYLINTARGSIVDEAAVADALRKGTLAGYAADVFEMEDLARVDRPTMVHNGLIGSQHNTLLTPHIGSADQRVRRLAELEAAQSILDALNGRAPPGAVNMPQMKALASIC